MKKIIIFLVVSIISLNLQADFEIFIQGETGDYISGGQTHLFSGSNDGLVVKSTENNILNLSLSQESWSFNFYAQLELLSDVYSEATRYPFQGLKNNGLSISSPGKGCNKLTGTYVIHEIEYLNNSLSKLAIDFVQYCGVTTAALRGGIRLNSAFPLPITSPLAVAGKDRLINEGGEYTLDGSASTSFLSDVQIVEHAWQQISGPAVLLLTASGPTLNFTAPSGLDLGGADIGFQLTVTDAMGNIGTDYVDLHVNSKSDPQTFLSMSSESGDYIGQGKNWFYTTDSSEFIVTASDLNRVYLSIKSNTTWSVNVAAPDADLIQTQTYTNVQREPFTDIGVAGLSVSGDGRGCNSLTGEFTVKTIEYQEASDDIDSYNAVFTQFCGNSEAALTGEIAYKAIDPSVPVALISGEQTTYEGSIVRLSDAGSYDNEGYINSFEWSQVSGPAITINNANSSSIDFISPLVAPNSVNERIVIELVVTDGEGFKDAELFEVVVLKNTSVPTTPTNLTLDLTASGKGKKRVITSAILSWIDNANNESGYSLERCKEVTTGKGKKKVISCAWSDFATFALDTTSYTPPLESGFRYRARAFNNIGSSGYSNEVRF